MSNLESANLESAMSGEAGGWMWLLIDVLAVAVLAAALIYAITVWRKRSRSADRAGEKATARLYRREDPESREPDYDRRAK